MKRLKIALIGFFKLLYIIFKFLVDIIKAILFIFVSLLNFINSFTRLLIPVIVLINSIEQLFMSDINSLHVQIDNTPLPQPIQLEYLNAMDVD